MGSSTKVVAVVADAEAEGHFLYRYKCDGSPLQELAREATGRSRWGEKAAGRGRLQQQRTVVAAVMEP